MDTPLRSYRQRLVVYAVWHTNFEHGPRIADALCTHLNAQPTQPGGGGLGIPVLFRCHPTATGVPRPIDFAESRNTAVVILVDDELVTASGWDQYCENLWNAARAASPAGAHRVFPVRLSPSAFNLSAKLAAINFIRPIEAPPGQPLTADQVRLGLTDDWDATWTRLSNAVVHELCRLVLARPRLDHEAAKPARLPEDQRVTIFLSHTKADGVAVAQNIKVYIQNDTQLRTFFDANDIPYGEEFDPVLRRKVGGDDAALMIIHTDAYSASEWCLEELLEAKLHRRPILVVNAVAAGEERAPVYAGNVPTRPHAPAGRAPRYDRIVGRMLLEVLRRDHFIQNFSDVRDLFELPADIEPLPYPPEPLTLADLKVAQVKTSRFVYPDPPLSRGELRRLEALDSKITLTTPLLLLATGARSADRTDPSTTDSPGPTPRLQGVRVGVSVANSPDLAECGLGPWHFNEATVSFARYLLACGADLCYGGIPELAKGPDGASPPNFLDQLLEMVRAYKRQGDDAGKGARLANYVAQVYKGQFTAAFRAKWKNVLDVEDVPAGVPDPGNDAAAADRAYYTARCLTAMREKMTEQIQARVLLGGKLRGFSGKYPGLVEEAYLAMSAPSPRPVYLVGAFGGGARAVIHALQRRPTDPYVPALSRAFYEEHDPGYKALAAVYDREQAAGRDEGLAHEKLSDFFAEKGVDVLTGHNGLSMAENQRLFETPHVVEIVYLVLLGLGRTLGDRGQ
jgi:hypothetical protein